MKQVKSQATDLRIIAFDSKFHVLKHETIKIAIIDKERLSLDELKNLHETGQIVSYRPENHRFRLDLLRAESWYRKKHKLKFWEKNETKFRQRLYQFYKKFKPS